MIRRTSTRAKRALVMAAFIAAAGAGPAHAGSSEHSVYLGIFEPTLGTIWAWYDSVPAVGTWPAILRVGGANIFNGSCTCSHTTVVYTPPNPQGEGFGTKPSPYVFTYTKPSYTADDTDAYAICTYEHYWSKGWYTVAQVTVEDFMAYGFAIPIPRPNMSPCSTGGDTRNPESGARRSPSTRWWRVLPARSGFTCRRPDCLARASSTTTATGRRVPSAGGCWWALCRTLATR